MRQAAKIIGNSISVLLFILMIVLAFSVVSSKVNGGQPTVFGYELKTVLSGSMEPVFHTGSIIAIEPKQEGAVYEVGDIITFRLQDGMTVTHRIVNVDATGDVVTYETKGDRNDAPDTDIVMSDNVVGKYTDFTIPYVGYIFHFASSKAGSALLLIIPGILLIAYAAISVFGVFKEVEKVKKVES